MCIGNLNYDIKSPICPYGKLTAISILLYCPKGSWTAINFTEMSICYLSCDIMFTKIHAGPRSAVGNVSGYRCVSDCRSRGHEFDPSPVPYFRGD